MNFPEAYGDLLKWPTAADFAVSHVGPLYMEKFEEFVIWTCGFTDPEHPPSQKKWEEFQHKVEQLAADFVEYKRQMRQAPKGSQYSYTSTPITT